MNTLLEAELNCANFNPVHFFNVHAFLWHPPNISSPCGILNIHLSSNEFTFVGVSLPGHCCSNHKDRLVFIPASQAAHTEHPQGLQRYMSVKKNGI